MKIDKKRRSTHHIWSARYTVASLIANNKDPNVIKC